MTKRNTVHGNGLSPLFYNVRTPLSGDGGVRYRVTRFGPLGSDFEIVFDCEEKPSALDGVARPCPSVGS